MHADRPEPRPTAIAAFVHGCTWLALFIASQFFLIGLISTLLGGSLWRCYGIAAAIAVYVGVMRWLLVPIPAERVEWWERPKTSR